MSNQDLFIEMALKAWNIQVSRTTKFIDSISDDAFDRAIAPGKNRIRYILGHLIAVNDGMITLFDKGNRSYASYDVPFVKNADGAEVNAVDIKTLRRDWTQSNQQLSSIFASMSSADWFARHTAMTDEDLLKEPSRNKLSVLLNRTSHVAYHLGQLVLVKEKAD